MQKSKSVTIWMSIVIGLYFLFSQFYLNKLGSVYTYFINPLFFIGMAFFLKFAIEPAYKTGKFKKNLIQYVLIAMLFYAFLYLISGMLTGFGKNPYHSSIRGVIFNLYSVGLVVLCREYIRFKLINNVFPKDRKSIFLVIVIIFSLQDLEIARFIQSANAYLWFKSFFYSYLPSLIKNALFSYLAIYSDYIPAVIYELLLDLLLWLPPILPNSPWVLESIMDTLFPLILLFYCRYEIASKQRFSLNKMNSVMDPKGLIPLAIGIVLVVWFALGIFPIKPVGVATGSMEPVLHVGDMIGIKEAGINDVVVGDIIQYKRKGYTVIHRIVEIQQVDGQFLIITKGDNNQDVDLEPVTKEQLVGKMAFRIPYLALPTIWLNSLSGQKQIVDVEMGS